MGRLMPERTPRRNLKVRAESGGVRMVMIALPPSEAANDNGMAWPFIPFPDIGTPPADRASDRPVVRPG